MRGLMWAALLLAPALATAAPASNKDGSNHSASTLVHLTLPYAAAQFPVETTFRIDVLSSSTPCGYGNITVNGQSLVQDGDGIGSGSITSREDNVVAAHWQFTCVETETAKQYQQLEFEVDFVDGNPVTGTKFTVQFCQVGHVEISHVEGVDVLRKPSSSTPASSIVAKKQWASVIAEELAELRYMELQRAELRKAIAQKKLLLAQAYDARRKEVKFSDCDNLECLASSVFTSVKHMALGFYHGITAEAGHTHSFSHHHGDYTQPPDHKPPFCHCPSPLRSTDGGGPGKGTNHQSPSWEDIHGRPAHSEQGPPPLGQDDSQGDEMVLQPAFQTFGQEQSSQVTSGSLERPPPPPGQSQPPAHGNAGHHPPPFIFVLLREHVSLTIVIGVFAIASLILLTFHRCCLARVKAIKARLRQRREARRREYLAHRQRCREQRALRRAAFRAKLKARFLALLQHLKDSISGRNAEDEEKEAVMRRIHSDDSDSDTMSTTMEQFRNVVGVVGDLVAAEEGRAYNHANRELLQRAMRVPPSHDSSFPDDISVDESLPAYDEASDELSRVADGLQYTPGSTMYTPSDASVTGSLDDVLGRKD